MRKIKKVPFFLFIVITIVIHPVLAQDTQPSPTGEGSLLESGARANTLDLEQVSDDELIRALDKADDIELINKEDNLTGAAVSSEAVHAEETPAQAAQETPANTAQETAGASRENAYLLQSRRLVKLAEETFSVGEYDTSTRFADEAAWLAKQSDVYVTITMAKRYLDQAVASGVSTRFSREYKEAENWYKQSAEARDNEDWDAAVDAANMVTLLLEGLGASGSRTSISGALPATYTVRSWSVSKDCFWNIAGQPWVYGNPRQWRTLYNANKSKLADPNNPNRLDPGIVLDIPSIKGEVRQGAWESGKTYESIR